MPRRSRSSSRRRSGWPTNLFLISVVSPLIGGSSRMSAEDNARWPLCRARRELTAEIIPTAFLMHRCHDLAIRPWWPTYISCLGRKCVQAHAPDVIRVEREAEFLDHQIRPEQRITLSSVVPHSGSRPGNRNSRGRTAAARRAMPGIAFHCSRANPHNLRWQGRERLTLQEDRRSRSRGNTRLNSHFDVLAVRHLP
jgi:hypothetical protein